MRPFLEEDDSGIMLLTKVANLPSSSYSVITKSTSHQSLQNLKDKGLLQIAVTPTKLNKA